MTGHYGVGDTHSPLKRALVRQPSDASVSVEAWRTEGYAAPRDASKAREEHAAFVETLRGEGVEVVVLPPDPAEQMDGCYACDPALPTPVGVIRCRMGKPGRRGEEAILEEALQEMGVPILGGIEAPGTLEGGDCIWLKPDCLAIGVGFRSNAAGVEQVRQLLEPHGIRVRAVELPWMTGPEECIHLGSLLNPIAPDLAIVHQRVLSSVFQRELEEMGFQLIAADEAEYDTQGNNLLALAPRRVLMAAGNPRTEALLRGHGVEVIVFAGDEVAIKGTGGPTCLVQDVHRAAE